MDSIQLKDRLLKLVKIEDSNYSPMRYRVRIAGKIVRQSDDHELMKV